MVIELRHLADYYILSCIVVVLYVYISTIVASNVFWKEGLVKIEGELK